MYLSTGRVGWGREGRRGRWMEGVREGRGNEIEVGREGNGREGGGGIGWGVREGNRVGSEAENERKIKMIGRRGGGRNIGMGRKEQIVFSKDDSCYITRACTCVYIQDHI